MTASAVLFSPMAVAEAPEAGTPPSRIADSICSPEFTTSKGRLAAGTAFVVGLSTGGSARFLVTAHHLFGPDGGLPRQIGWSALPAYVQSVRCRSIRSEATLSAGPPLRVRGARPHSDKGTRRDIALFSATQSAGITPLDLAPESPAKTTRVWLVAELQNDAGELFHPGVVDESHAEHFYVVFDNPKIELGGSSGAPVVNDRGQVVGIHLASLKEGNNKVGYAGSATAAAAALPRAITEAAPQGSRVSHR